jgi:hypothetical protein
MLREEIDSSSTGASECENSNIQRGDKQVGRKNRRDDKKNDYYAEKRRERELDKLRRELIKPSKPFFKDKQKPNNYKPKNKKD